MVEMDWLSNETAEIVQNARCVFRGDGMFHDSGFSCV